MISERRRDKVWAARRKGKWIGGIPILGYDQDPRNSTVGRAAKTADQGIWTLDPWTPGTPAEY